jgi:hypothetical protein
LAKYFVAILLQGCEGMFPAAHKKAPALASRGFFISIGAMALG